MLFRPEALTDESLDAFVQEALRDIQAKDSKRTKPESSVTCGSWH